ncbi:EamA family transporter [Streptomyces sp. ISL-22]|uniref:DMT family transporter n=1 Tax=unclassified Streptomyces TaxID=2593676 RepID=UPI001BEA7920|nr:MULTISPECIES: EamA family transporter [unclassified Streptomyces]MBT2418531.1 EamA family transporter [Streptomyces sp. ISL-24]MBT2434366.1 EamA family transporter [Streptomyces sp. ISL-22]
MPNRTTPLTPARPADSGPRRALAGLLGGPAPILTSAVLWGTTGTAGSLAPAGAPAAAIGCAGLTLGGLLLFLTSRGARSLPAACTRAERWLLVLGALAVAGYPVTFYPAVARTRVAVATVIALGSAPVFAGLLSWLTGHARPTARWTCATAAAVLGCTLLVLGPELTGHATPMDLTGVALAACAGLSYAAYSLIGGRLITREHSSDAVMGVLFGAAGLLVLPLFLFVDTHWLATTRGAAVAVYLALFTVYLAYRLFGHGLRHTPASVATTLTLAEPAVAAVLGVTVLDERLPAASWCGLAVLALALVLLTAPAGSGRRAR